MAVKDSHPVPEETARRVNAHLSRQVPDDADVVVPEHDLDRDPGREERGEEPEEDGTKRGRGPHDGVFHVAGDHQRRRVILAQDPEESLGEELGGTFGRPTGPVRTSPEPEMEVGDDDGAGSAFAPAPEQERRLVEDRA